MSKLKHAFSLALLVASLLVGCGPSSNVLQIALDVEDEGRYDE